MTSQNLPPHMLRINEAGTTAEGYLTNLPVLMDRPKLACYEANGDKLLGLKIAKGAQK